MKRLVHKLHIERLSARKYYGHMAPGQVVLVNGYVRFHGNGWEARKFESRIAINMLSVSVE
jgi:hypothetical protein